VSQIALDYLMSSDAVKALPGNDKLVLRAIALTWNPEVGCAFPNVAFLASQALLGGKDPERQCRRILERLEAKGFLVRHVSLRPNGSHTTNEYELPGMKASTAVDAQARQRVFKVPRTRVAAQLSLLMDDGAMVAKKKRSKTDRSDAKAAGSAEVETVEKFDEVSAQPRTPMCPPPPGHPEVSALEVVFDVALDVPLSLPLLKPVECVKASSTGQEQEQANARATTNAKTGASEAAMASTESAGEPGTSSGRVLEFRLPRQDRRRERLRVDLDGMDAAIFDEANDVLEQCGVPVDASTRRLRQTVGRAIERVVKLDACTIAQAGDVAVSRWQMYERDRDRGLLAWSFGMRNFFKLDAWLYPDKWPYRTKSQGRFDARVGMSR
jgi:hypothetical protein